MALKAGQEALQKLYFDDSGIVRVALDQEFEQLASKEADVRTREGDIEIAGWFITEKLIESRKLLVLASAFRHDTAFERFNGRVLAFHNQLKEPIGEVIEMKIVPKQGIKGKVRIWRENPELLMRGIREGILSGFSIGFSIEKWSYDEKTEVITVTEGSFKELSVVNIGADKNATFEVLNALCDVNNTNDDTITVNIPKMGRSQTLAEGSKNETVTMDQLLLDNKPLQEHVRELRNALTALKEAQTQAKDELITKTELAERLQKISTSVSGIEEEIKVFKAENSAVSVRLAYKDYRSLIRDFIWLTDDDGNRLGHVAQRAYCLFQMPVDYDKMDGGYELKNLRDLYDATLLSDAMMRFKGRDRHSIHNLKLYKQLIKCTEKFDKDVALAMAAGNTGYGAEWIPEELSSEFNEYLRKQPSLANRFMLWNMPKGGSAKFPFQNGKAVVYKGGEALVDNAEEARKTNIATGAKTFTPDLFIGALVSSEEITEDAVLDMVQFIRAELSTALLEGLESAICNGDDSATHFDNAAGTTPYETYNVETCFKGIRKLGIANTRDIEVSSSTTGVNSLELVNFTDAKQDLGVAGLIPTNCINITGIKGRTLVQNALFKEDALGVLAFMISGTLPTIDGSEIFISGQYDELLSSAGIRDSTADEKHTSMCCVHKPSFRLASRRGVTLEFNKNVLTQQQQFVATARWDFGKISADAIQPVSEMINMQHTA